MEGEVDEAMLAESAFGVGLYQAVDVYQRGERAIKYALLFIALTFLTFFAWEQISRIRMHPLQYLLVGLALSMFYLLLIALSEHIALCACLAVAAAALVLLIGIYIAGALRSRARGVGCRCGDDVRLWVAVRARAVGGLRAAARRIILFSAALRGA